MQEALWDPVATPTTENDKLPVDAQEGAASHEPFGPPWWTAGKPSIAQVLENLL